MKRKIGSIDVLVCAFVKSSFNLNKQSLYDIIQENSNSIFVLFYNNAYIFFVVA